jgi:hypothetical protein
VLGLWATPFGDSALTELARAIGGEQRCRLIELNLFGNLTVTARAFEGFSQMWATLTDSGGQCAQLTPDSLLRLAPALIGSRVAALTFSVSVPQARPPSSLKLSF